MRKLRLSAAIVFALLPLTLKAGPIRGQAANSTSQRLFLGDRACNDDRTSCLFAPVTATYPYLHVIVHDQIGNDDWQVQGGAACTPDVPTLAGGQPIPDSHYLEAVINLTQGIPQLLGRAACYLFRGRHQYGVTFYAAYFDNSPAFDAASVLPNYQSLNGLPDLADLDVTYIHRDPTLAYDASPNMPAPGERVTFQAHVRNAGAGPSGPFNYRWTLDGHTVSTGASAAGLSPGQELTFAVAWRWQPTPHTLRFTLVPSTEEISVQNNTLAIRTDALSLGFWIEQSAWQYFNTYQWTYCQVHACAGSDSFADWLQRQIGAWNSLLGGAHSSPDTPNGIADRVRLDAITITPDGSLPLHGGRPTNSPDRSDHSVDLEWGLPAQGIESAYHRIFEGPFDLDWALLHELSHARSLADLYRFDVGADGAAVAQVRTAAGGAVFDPVHPLDTTRPLVAHFVRPHYLLLYQNTEDDLMSCDCTARYSAYDALIWNRIRGRRARCGNFNSPCNLGDWYLDLPQRNKILLLDHHGYSLPRGTEVRIFYDEATGYSNHLFSPTDSHAFTVTRGAISLGSDPFADHGSRYLAGHNLLLMEVHHGPADTFCFIEPSIFNLARWRGYGGPRHPARYTFREGRQHNNGCNLQPPAPLVNEPFATSPATSTFVITARPGGSAQLRVHLLDDSRPPIPMRGRRVVAYEAGGRRSRPVFTDNTGRATLIVHRPLQGLTVRDQTDNGLLIGPPAATRSTSAAQQP